MYGRPVGRARTIYTVGHSTRTLAELVAILRAHGVTQLVDVRSIRRSRAFPHFAEGRLRSALTRRGIAYAVIEALGGRRGKAKPPPKLANDAWDNASFKNYADHASTPAFRAGLRELRALARAHPTAIMCSEAVWWRCHRRIIADHLLARGVTVVHLMSPTVATPATLTPFAKVVGRSVHYPRARTRASPRRRAR